MTEPAEPPATKPSVHRLDATGAAVGGLLGIVGGTAVFTSLLFLMLTSQDIHPIFFVLLMTGGGVAIPLVALKLAELGGQPAERGTAAGPGGVGGQTSVAIPAHTGEDVVPPAVSTETTTTNTVER